MERFLSPSFHFFFRWKFLFPPADMLYTEFGPGLTQPFECYLEPLLCLEIIRPENSVLQADFVLESAFRAVIAAVLVHAPAEIPD